VTEPVIYELSVSGRCGVSLPDVDVPQTELPAGLMRCDLPLPEVGEVDLMRHYTRLSQMNHGVDIGFYPLGSCTMKYNPKVNEETARLPGFVRTHPYQHHCTVQGNLELMYGLQEQLKALSGFDAVSLQPAAGAHGEFAGILIMRAYHEYRGDERRFKILIPDSGHGTNPASATMSGYQMVELRSDSRGNVDLSDLRAHCDETVVGLMLTNPNTLGLFEEHLQEICDLVHACGGLMYGDGANFNALMGIAKPAELGFDVMHFNLHKTFSTPHGGGGPGSGPVGVVGALAGFLPGPIVEREEEGTCGCGEDGRIVSCYHLVMPALSIGRLKSFYGNFGVMVKAYTYIRMLGGAGLREASEMAVLSANYLQTKLKGAYPLPYDRICMHEFVLEGHLPEAPEVHALDISKRLMDYGYHPPTNYFPLIVPEALMIEPTETESRQTLDSFIEAMLAIAREAVESPELLHEAPHSTPITRVDEVRAARQLKLRRET
jgi:glycine dehydrogenase subunit 2